MKNVRLFVALCLTFAMLIPLCFVAGTGAAAAELPLAWHLYDERISGAFDYETEEWLVWTDAKSGEVHYDCGKFVFDEKEQAVVLSYSPADAEGNDYKRGNYRLMPRLLVKNLIPASHPYVRVVYKATNPKGEKDPVRLVYNNNGAWNSDLYIFEDDVKDTNGEYVLSDVCKLSDKAIQRLNNSSWLTLYFDASNAGGEYAVRAMYFFASEAEAKNFKIGDTHKTVNGETVGKTEDPAEWKEPKILTLKSRATSLKGTMTLFVDNTAPLESGTYEFDKENGALLLTYSANKRGNYRLAFRVPSTSQYEKDFRYLRVTYKTDYDAAFPLILTNNGTGEELILDKNTGRSQGEWVTTQVYDFGNTTFVSRFERTSHVTLGVPYPMEGAKIWIKEIAMFASEAQAYDYYGDEPGAAEEDPVITWRMTDEAQTTYHYSEATEWLLWKDETTGKIHYDCGLWELDSDVGAIRLYYSPADADGNAYLRGNYRAMPRFKSKNTLSSDYKYARALYRATNAEAETEPVVFYLRNNGGWGDYILFEDDVQNTDGKFVLSDTAEVLPQTIARLNASHLTLYFDAKKPGADYQVKEIYFFTSKEQADAFTGERKQVAITVGDTDISEFRIVIDDEASSDTKNSAVSLCAQIETLTGVRLPVVSDAEPEQEHEIIIGNTNRAVCASYYGKEGVFLLDRNKENTYEIAVRDGKLCFAGGMAYASQEAVTSFMQIYLGLGGITVPDSIAIASDFVMNGSASKASVYNWPEPEEGVVRTFADDFEDETAGEDPDYWMEHALTDAWKVQKDGKDLVYAANADNMTFSWLHVFERDVEYTANMKVVSAEKDGQFGMLLRFNEDEIYIRVGYDFETGAWFVRDKQGDEYEILTYDTKQADLKQGEWFTLRAVLNGSELQVYLHDEKTPVLSTTYLQHLSPGRVGFFAEGAEVLFDDVDLVQTSGQGRVQNGVQELPFGHRELDVLNGSQGKSIYELEDGSLVVMNLFYHSDDDGITWKPTSEALPGWGEGYSTGMLSQILRLESGRLLNLKDTTVDGKRCFISQYSDDDGYTWKDGGYIADYYYKGYTTTRAINMNDKITQMSDGRIFATVNYEGDLPAEDPNSLGGAFRVWVEVYYSDDDGITWKKSETDSFGISDSKYLGESIIIEGQNGQLAWVTSWATVPELLVSVSEDNGVTWGKAEFIKDFAVSCASSCIKRDVYAEENTYYMVSVFNRPFGGASGQPRSRLGLFRTHDGLNWEYLCDVDRIETSVQVGGSFINIYVNPSITVTEDYVYVGSGRSEFVLDGDGHQGQTQMFIRFEKDQLEAYDIWPTYQ